MDELQRELLSALKDLYAGQMAARNVLQALITSHPRPALLHEMLMSSMDITADSLGPDRIPIYREAMQQYAAMAQTTANQANASDPRGPSEGT